LIKIKKSKWFKTSWIWNSPVWGWGKV